MDGHQSIATIETVIGRVVSIAGAQVIGHLDVSGTHGPDGALQIGTLIKVEMPQSVAYGIVNGLTIPMPSEEDPKKEMQLAEFTMVGEIAKPADGKAPVFRRGISCLPSLGDTILRTTKDDLARVYAAPDRPSVKVGAIHQDSSLSAHVLTDELLGKHFAVLGTTGSGKSCAVVLMLSAILDQHPNAHIVMLDPHNEYARAFGDRAEILNTDNLELPYWLLNFEELTELLFSGEGGKESAEAAILAELIPRAKREYHQATEPGRNFTANTPVPYKFSYLVQLIEDDMGKLDNTAMLAPYRRLQSRLSTLQSDVRYSFMFGGISVTDTMASVIKRMFRIPVNGKPISIVDLSGVPSEILNVVVGIICRLTFDFALWSDRQVPILLVCEEAHRYAPSHAEPRFTMTKNALSRIAKEGRKYGVSLCVISQRPSRLSTDLLSQCNTLFALRITNNDDQNHLGGAIADSSTGLLEFLPSLGNSEAIAVGQGMSMPVRIKFNRLPSEIRPHSATAIFSESWQEESDNDDFVDQVVKRWRRTS